MKCCQESDNCQFIVSSPSFSRINIYDSCLGKFKYTFILAYCLVSGLWPYSTTFAIKWLHLDFTITFPDEMTSLSTGLDSQEMEEYLGPELDQGGEAPAGPLREVVQGSQGSQAKL